MIDVEAIQLASQFLVLDMRPAASLSLKIPKPRGDWQWIAFEGVLYDGMKIRPYEQDFARKGRRKLDCTYLISILEAGSGIETRMTECQ